MVPEPLPSGPLVTVYVTCHNYGRFLRECLESVFVQSLQEWELLIYDEGSSDDTAEIAIEYERRDPERVRLFRSAERRGLRACANDAIRKARGRYLMRLDADDYLDESALLVMCNKLEGDRDLGLVYPNWIYLSETGDVLGVENRRKPGLEADIADLPPHGACTMIRRRALLATGGYDEGFDAQDGHELWLKLLHRYKSAHISTPLFFYRQHGASMSVDAERLLAARRAIKRQAAGRWSGPTAPRAVGIVPVKNTYTHIENVALEEIVGQPLIDYTLDEAIAAGCFEEILVTTDDERVVEHCQRRGDVIVELRPAQLSSRTSKLSDVLQHAVEHLEADRSLYPDVLVLLGIHTPLRTHEHIREAIDTLLLYDVDHVLSVYEDLDIHFRHGRLGLEPLNPGMVNRLRYEREALYVDNGAIHAVWRDLVGLDTRLSGRVSHIVMPRDESHQLRSAIDREVISVLLQSRKRSLA